MKKLFLTLIFLFFIYFLLQAVFYYFGPGHTVEYNAAGFEVKEVYINKQKEEKQSYNFTIKTNENKFYLQIFKDYENEKKVIKDIKSTQTSDMLCIIPVFINDEILTDVMCLKNNVIYNYADLNHSNKELEEFYSSLNITKSEDDLNNQESRNNVILYKNNFQPNYYLSIDTYKGFVYANATKKMLYSKNIFTNDVYDNYLSTYVNEYYVTVNYDEQYGYSKIYVYDIVTGKEEIITLAKNIEKNTYIQGIYNNSLYLFDRSSKKQYEINTETMTVLEVGNVSTGIKIYKNGTFERVSAHECANNDILFEEKGLDNDNYLFLASTGGKQTGYTYYYQKQNNSYRIYRVNNVNKEQYTYLFNTKYLDQIKIVNEYIFFIDNNYLRYYSDYTGIRTLAYNSELTFNQNIKYQIIYQK